MASYSGFPGVYALLGCSGVASMLRLTLLLLLCRFPVVLALPGSSGAAMPDKYRPTKRMRDKMRGKCQKSNSYDAVDLEYDFLEHMVKKTDIPMPHLIEVIQGLRDFAADEEDGSFKIASILKLSLNLKWALTTARTN